jgi:hypothetical protein
MKMDIVFKQEDTQEKKFQFEFACEGQNLEWAPYYKNIYATSLVEAESIMEKTPKLLSYQFIASYDVGPNLEDLQVGDPVQYSSYSLLEKRIVTKSLKHHIVIGNSERKFRRDSGQPLGEKYGRTYIQRYDEESIINYEKNRERKRKRNAIVGFNFNRAHEEIINAVYAILEESGAFKEKTEE